MVNPRRPRIDRIANAATTFVPMHAVNERTGEIRHQEARPYSLVEKGYSYFENGDVLFAKVSPCMQNGKHALVQHAIDGFGFGSTEFHVVRPGPGVMSRWLVHLLRQGAVIDSAARTFAGSVGLQRVPDTFLRNLEFDLPPLVEQQEAVVRLDECLRLAGRCEDDLAAAFDASSRLQTVLLAEEFTGFTPLSVREVAALPQGWKSFRLTEVARLESGHTPSRRHPEWWGGHVPWLALPDIRKLHGKWAHETTENINDAGLANSSARLLPVGTVCLCRDASIGFVTVLGRPMATSQHFANWVCDPERLDPEFLLYAFMASHEYLRELGSGSVLKTIYMPTIKSFHICAPGIADQRRIARTLRDRLTAAETLTKHLRERQAEIQRLPQRLLAAAFAQVA